MVDSMKKEEQTNSMNSIQTQHDDPFNWLTLQNNELKEKIKKLESGLYQWKLNACETNERLRRVMQNINKTNYVDSFYDSQTRRLVESLSEENVLLKNELCLNDGNSVSTLSELRKTIQMLKDQLHIKNNENKVLKNELEQLKCPNLTIDELKNKVAELLRNNSRIAVENTNLKSHARNQTDVMNYLKSQFGKQRKEFLTIFSHHYTQYGEEFIKQLKSMDGGGALSFLSKPLSGTKRDASTNTVYPNKDSGIDTLPDELRELMSTAREMEEAKAKIDRLEHELKNKRESEGRMERVLTIANERYATLEAEVMRVKKERDEAKDDALCWQTALQQFQKEGGLHQPQHEPKYSAKRELLHKFPLEGSLHHYQHGQNYTGKEEMIKAAEPYQTVRFPQRRSLPHPILVRDASTKRTNTLFPSASEDGSDYTPKGSLPHSISAPDMSSSFPGHVSSSSNTGEEIKRSSFDYRTATSKPMYIQCEKCKRPIDAEDIEVHKLHCQ